LKKPRPDQLFNFGCPRKSGSGNLLESNNDRTARATGSGCFDRRSRAGGLSCALHTRPISFKKHNEAGGKTSGSLVRGKISTSWKRDVKLAAHQLSGAIMNPKALAELVPISKRPHRWTLRSPRRGIIFTKNSSVRFPADSRAVQK